MRSHTLGNAANPTFPKPNTQAILDPDDFDCLFGRGKRFQNHPGNHNLRRLVDLHHLEFVSSGIEGKNRIISKIVVTIQQGDIDADGNGTPPGRFLKRREYLEAVDGKTSFFWEEASDSDAWNKVGHTIRSRIRPNRVKLASPPKTKPLSQQNIAPKYAFPHGITQPTSVDSPGSTSSPVSLSIDDNAPAMQSNDTLLKIQQAQLEIYLQEQQIRLRRQRMTEQEHQLKMHLKLASDAELLALSDRLLRSNLPVSRVSGVPMPSSPLTASPATRSPVSTYNIPLGIDCLW